MRASQLRTPWGQSQHIEDIAPGIRSISTAGHGGFKLDRARNAQVPEYLRREGGWYEEDVDYAIVYLTFPSEFSEQQVADARDTIRHYYPDEYERLTGETITPGQSRTRDEQEFNRVHADDYIAYSAMGSPAPSYWERKIPEGYVEVVAGRGQRGPRGERPADEGTFLVPADEYEQRGLFGFVVDPSRHERVAERRKGKKIGKIEDDTAIMPWIVADAVIREAEQHVGEQLPMDEYAERLSNDAQAIYENNESFRKKIRSEADDGRAGRDNLYMYMRHWLSSMILKDKPALARRIPADFANGLEVEPGSSTRMLREGGGGLEAHDAAPYADAVEELLLYIDNDGDLYRQQTTSIMANLARKMAKDKYDPTQAVKAWRYLADAGAQKYTREEFGAPGPHGSYGGFSPADRQAVATELARRFEQQVNDGEIKIDDLIKRRASEASSVIGDVLAIARDNHGYEYKVTVEPDRDGDGFVLRPGNLAGWNLVELEDIGDRLFIDFGQNWYLVNARHVVDEVIAALEADGIDWRQGRTKDWYV